MHTRIHQGARPHPVRHSHHVKLRDLCMQYRADPQMPGTKCVMFSSCACCAQADTRAERYGEQIHYDKK